jgi:hypothetical protein
VGLLHDIQTAARTEDADLGAVFQVVDLLAPRIKSRVLIDWARYEAGGYPENAEVPDYRNLPVTHRASFSRPSGGSLQGVLVAPCVIAKYAGEHWTHHGERRSITSIDDLLAHQKAGEPIAIESSSLTLLLQGRTYAGRTFTSVTGTVSQSSLTAIRRVIRSRIFELTIELERCFPGVFTVASGHPVELTDQEATAATQVAQLVIYHYTTIDLSDAGAH